MTGGRQIHFYAMHDDLVRVLAEFELRASVKYTLNGLFESAEVKSYLSYRDIPDLGKTRHPSAIAGCSYLVTDQSVNVKPIIVPQIRGGVRYSITQRNAWDSVVVLPGGTFDNQVLLYGNVGTISDSQFAVRLYGILSRIIKKHYRKIETYWVGQSAEAFGKAGGRLTGSRDSPALYDLRLPN